MLHCFGNYNHLKENGITSDGAYYATLVRNGLLTRSEALEKEKAIKKSLKHDCMNVIKHLDIDINEKFDF